jgi:hypothetical protein
MSVEQRIRDLIELLIRGTRKSSLEWQSTADENSFRLSAPAGNIRLTRSEESYEDGVLLSRILSILNDKGRVIEQYSPSGASEEGVFDELFTLARRSAYKSNEVLERLMGEIQRQVQEGGSHRQAATPG